MRPLLQLALDETSLHDAFNILSTGVDEIVDIIECGTVLLASEGKNAIIKLREKYPDRKLVCDFKIADSGKTQADLFLEGKPDYLTVICSAHNKTKKAIVDEIKEKGLNTEVQIELYGNWTIEDVRAWKEIGINHVVAHHSVDEKGPWTNEELQLTKQLCDEDINVTVTGGVTLETIELFKGLPIFCIIAGRSIRTAIDPVSEAKKMKDRIIEIWNN